MSVSLRKLDGLHNMLTIIYTLMCVLVISYYMEVDVGFSQNSKK